MDPVTIASLIAMVASAAMQQHAQAQAADRQKRLAVEAQQRQLMSQNQATDVAMKRVQEFDPGKRQDNQQQIQQDLTSTLDQQVAQPQITAQGVQVGATIPQTAGSSDYLAAQAREQAKTTASLRGLAALMGRIGSADQLRRNEAVGIGDTAGDIGRIQNGADNTFGIDQVGINAVRPNSGMMLASAALRAYGASGAGGTKSANYSGSAGGNPQYPDYGRASGSNGAWV